MVPSNKEEEIQVAQLVAEIDNLNSLINGIEKEMLKLKQRPKRARVAAAFSWADGAIMSRKEKERKIDR